MNKALFLDRDGIINVEKNYVYSIEDFEFVDGVIDLMSRFQSSNYLIFVITNQAGIGRGYYTEADFLKLTKWMKQSLETKGVKVSDVYYCPFHPEYGIGPYKQESYDRKPNPGMILKAQLQHDIDVSSSVLVGDKESDIEAGHRAGIGVNILLRSSPIIDDLETMADKIINRLSELEPTDIERLNRNYGGEKD